MSNKLSYYKNLTNRLSIKNEFNFFLKIKLHLNDEDIHINKDRSLSKKEQNLIEDFFLNAEKGLPLDYILNSSEFYENNFYVDSRVLIPRSETEILVDYVNKNFTSPIKVLDVGTGSGCIVVSLIKERPKCKATAIDISLKALNVAKTNAKLHQLENKIKFINIDIDKYKSYNYDLIISNPPYINNVEFNRLDDDIKFHEPKLALSGGSNGFRDLKKVIIKSRKLLKNNGKLILEIGYKQKKQCLKILNENRLYVNKISKDLSGKDRCIVSTKII